MSEACYTPNVEKLLKYLAGIHFSATFPAKSIFGFSQYIVLARICRSLLNIRKKTVSWKYKVYNNHCLS
jgi:hypothetical protein